MKGIRTRASLIAAILVASMGGAGLLTNTGLSSVVGASLTMTTGAVNQDDTWSTIHVRGEAAPFAIPLTAADGKSFEYQLLHFWCWPPNVNDFAFTLLAPQHVLANETDLWQPPAPGEYPVLREDVRYHRPMTLRSDHYLSARLLDTGAFVGEENVFPLFPSGYPSNKADSLDLLAAQYWWIFACSGSWELDVAFRGASAGAAVALSPLERAVWSEHDFDETVHVASGPWGMPNPAVGTEAVYGFAVEGPQYVFVAAQTGMGTEEYRLLSPSEREIPFWKNHESAFGTSGNIGGTVVVGVRDFEVDRIVREEGRWRLIVDPKASPNFEFSVYRLDLGPLVGR